MKTLTLSLTITTDVSVTAEFTDNEIEILNAVKDQHSGEFYYALLSNKIDQMGLYYLHEKLMDNRSILDESITLDDMEER